MGKRDLPEFEHFVLLALVRLGKEGYGMTVRRELEYTSGRSVTIGSVYATLERLEARGYVASWHGEPDPVRGGRARRNFEPTPEGLVALARAREVMDRMWDGVTIDGRIPR
jgi:DNA-binding PadR family transcriptional regulator